MKLKYYLRGLGIGIVVTAIIVGSVGTKRQARMTDAQIIARAKELGMIDGVLSQLEVTEETEMAAAEENESAEKVTVEENKSAAEESEKVIVEENKSATEKEAQKQSEAQKQTGNKIENKTEDKVQKPKEEVKEKTEEKKPEKEVVKKIVITVYPGEGSYTVSRKLAALGLVESADIYDKFLCQNGYDKKITTGNHEVEVGMTAEQIAKALTVR